MLKSEENPGGWLIILNINFYINWLYVEIAISRIRLDIRSFISIVKRQSPRGNDNIEEAPARWMTSGVIQEQRLYKPRGDAFNWPSHCTDYSESPPRVFTLSDWRLDLWVIYWLICETLRLLDFWWWYHWFFLSDFSSSFMTWFKAIKLLAEWFVNYANITLTMQSKIQTLMYVCLPCQINRHCDI